MREEGSLLDKKKLILKIDKRFKDLLDKESYEIIEVDAQSFLTNERADICLKYRYIDAIVKGDNILISEFETAYLDTISAFTYGSYIEPGETIAKSKKDYIEKFKNLYTSIKESGFNNKQLIPVSRDFVPLDGAHRIAIAAYLNLSVKCVVINTESLKCDVDFFKSKNVKKRTIDILIDSIIEFDSTLRLAIIWPHCKVPMLNVYAEFGDKLVDSKSMNLNENGVNNLCVISYFKESWIGDVNNSWAGSVTKSSKCYDTGGFTHCVLYKTSGLKNDIKLKERIRLLADGQKHNIHSTDTHKETKELSLICFNNETSCFLNNINLIKIRRYLDYKDNFYNFDADFIFVGSTVLELLGVRSARDIDVIVDSDDVLVVDSHNEYYKLYPNDFSIYFNCDWLVFHFMGLKFINLADLTKFKKSRGEAKDQVDIIKLNKITSDNKGGTFLFINEFLLVIKRESQNLKFTVYYAMIKLIKMLRLLNLVKKCLKAFKI